jgi:homoserine O-acetyltransferase
MSIEADATWKQKSVSAGINGMKAARACALLSYRNYQTYTHSQPVTSSKIFSDTDDFTLDKIRTGAASYQRYQGEKLARRFNAFSYYFLSLGMDSHNVGRGRGRVEDALQKIKAKTLVIGIVTDILFPLNEQQFIATNIKGAEYKAINSLYGHDGFLLEFEQIENLLKNFILKEANSTLVTQDIHY